MKNQPTLDVENKSFQQEFDSILTFISETCNASNVFLTQITLDGHSIVAKIGPDIINCTEKFETELLPYIKSVFEQKEDLLLSNTKNRVDLKLPSTNSYLFNFFTGIPLLNSKIIVVGTLCIMDLELIKLSLLQKKIIKHSSEQILSIIKLREKNNDLQKSISHKKNQLQLYFENSRNIAYELNLEGVFTYVSSNWLVLLGYESFEVEGKSFVNFIHIEDIK